MKMLLLLLLLPAVAISQDAPKGATTIIVTGANFTTVANKVLDAGFAIDKKDTDLGTIRTIEKQLKRTASLFIMNIRVIDSVAYISGESKSLVKLFNIEPNYSSVMNKGGDNKIIFSKMIDVAKSLGGTISYK